MRVLLGILAALVLMAATPFPPPCRTNPPQPDRRHPSGLLIVAPLDRCAIRTMGSIDDMLGKAWSDARLLVEANQNVMAPPWGDRARRELVLSVTSADGETIARRWVAQGAVVPAGVKTAELARPQVPVRFRTVKRSYADLQRLGDEIIELTRAKAVPGTDAIRSFGADEERNAILMEVQSLSDDLAKELVRRFGTEAVIVRVDPSSGPFTSLAAGLEATGLSLMAIVILACGLILIGLALWRGLRRA